MTVEASHAHIQSITSNISAYYVENARDLPWRSPPGTTAPPAYHVWLSEVMLQQTTVAAVKNYYQRFLSLWPSVMDLAAAEQADVLAQWAGLGYYARARNLHNCAQEVTEKHNGIFPGTEAELRRLPGIGDYTAAAVAAIAFDQRTVVIDANIERLVARLFAIDAPLPAGKRLIRAGMDAITPATGAGDFAQACMDIGAVICTARAPQCSRCPVAEYCAAHKLGEMEKFPIKPMKKKKPVRRGRFFWVEREGEILLVQRPGKGMLAGMRALPDDRWFAGADGDGKPPFDGPWDVFENCVQHGFTHFALNADIARFTGDAMTAATHAKAMDNAIWWPLNRLEDAGLPTLFAKAVRWIKERDDGED